MKSGQKLGAWLGVTVAVGSVFIPTVAEAQGFFESLFGPPKRRVIHVDEYPGNSQRATRYPAAPKIENRKKQAVKAAVIAAPAYYTYKPDLMVQVDFSKIVAAPQKIALTVDPFSQGLPGLSGYQLRAEKPVAAAIADYYSSSPAFVWVTDGKPNAKAEEAIRLMSEADAYALSPNDYEIERPAAGADAATLMRFEMALSARVLRYIHDASNGRIEPNRISGYYDFPEKPLDYRGQLDTLSRTAEVATYLGSRHPQNPQYQQLKDELAALRKTVGDEVAINTQINLKPGEASPELPKITKLIASRLDDETGGEFGELLYRTGGSETYAPELVPVIKAEQKKAGLKADGVIGPRTVKALVGPSQADRLGKVEIAMEQLRWLPSEFGSPRVWINQPAYTAQYIVGETPQLSMRVVVGAFKNQTSFFYDEIEQIDYNPYWGVPQSIIVNEMLPRLRRDPGYLDRAGYEVFNAKGKRVSSSSVAWGSYSAKSPLAVRQTPSEANALGELKILFPNKHAIYMHDTPQKSFFQRDMRALSHGCIRLSDPRAMAAAVLGKDVQYVADKIGKGHSMEKTPKIPVYVSYFTAWPNEQGQVEYFDDVYNRDARLSAAVEATDDVRTASVKPVTTASN